MVADHSTPEIPTRTCTKCGETKPETEFWFHRTKKHPFRRRSRCKPCETADHAAYVETHRDELNAYCRAQRRGNERHLHVKRAWTEANREKVNQQHRERQPIYTVKYRTKRQQRSVEKKETLSVYHRQWRQNNPAHLTQYDARRRARERNAPLNDLTLAQWQEIQAIWDHRCAYCTRRMKGRLDMDHIIPLSKGGSHTASNIVPACRSCNAKKHAGPPLTPVQPLLLTVAPARKKR